MPPNAKKDPAPPAKKRATSTARGGSKVQIADPLQEDPHKILSDEVSQLRTTVASLATSVERIITSQTWRATQPPAAALHSALLQQDLGAANFEDLEQVMDACDQYRVAQGSTRVCRWTRGWLPSEWSSREVMLARWTAQEAEVCAHASAPALPHARFEFANLRDFIESAFDGPPNPKLNRIIGEKMILLTFKYDPALDQTKVHQAVEYLNERLALDPATWSASRRTALEKHSRSRATAPSQQRVPHRPPRGPGPPRTPQQPIRRQQA
jgi:hypothetical protein